MKHHLRRLGSNYHRTRLALSYYWPKLRMIPAWLRSSREETNFTYDITPRNRLYLAHTLVTVLDRPLAEVQAYIDEALADEALAEHVVGAASRSPQIGSIDATCHFGRRLGWYAAARALKPRVVVETGVDKGLGAVLLCAALRRNEAEGTAGRYYGIDINPQAGFLLCGPYASRGEILTGDSVATLRTFPKKIDLLVTDADHALDHEYREYLAARDRLSETAIILADNAHAGDALARFAAETGRKFLFFCEEPLGHWYPGAGIGFCWRG